MKTLLLFLAIIVSQSGLAQNRVVKDNLACLYGIKNPEGDWVVKPKHILLTGYSYGYFLTQEGPNYGLLAQDGTELLPCEYSKIKPLNYSWQPHGLGQAVQQKPTGQIPMLFQVEKQVENSNMRALVNGSGKTLVPLKTQFFRTDGQQHVIITEYRSPNHFTSYINVDGNYLFKDLPGAIEPFRSNQIALIGSRTPGSNGTVEGNVRVINKKGEYIGSHLFNRAIICGQGRIVFEDSLGHIGTMDATGRMLIEPKYKYLTQSSFRENILPCLYSAQHTFVIQDDEGKLGLMDGSGKIVCTPRYDYLKKLQGQWKTKHTSWRVSENGKTGMLSENGKTSIPCSFDTIIPFKMSYVANAELDGFIVADAGKFGLIKTQGDTIVPLEHAFFQYAPRSRSVLFGDSKQLSEITLLNNELNIEPIEKLVQLTDYSVFKGKNDDYFVLKEAENGDLEVIRSEKYMNVLWFQQMRSYATIIDITGKRLDEGNVSGVNQKFRFLDVRTSEGTRYLIDAKSAKRITEPSAKAEFQLQGSSATQVWSKGVVDPSDSWVLLDTNGQRAGTASFDQTFNLNTDQVSLRQDGYWGIYSVFENEWLLSPKYTCIDIISEEIFRARLQNGKWELHSLEKKALYGPFESLKVLCSSYESNGYGSNRTKDVLLLASQNGTSFLIDENGRKVSNLAEMKRIQTELAYGVYKIDQKPAYSRGIKIIQNQPDFTVTPLYAQLYDIILEMHPKLSINQQSNSVNQHNCRCEMHNDEPLKSELSYAKPNAASVTISRFVSPRESWNVGHYEIQNYINAILVKGEMKQIELRAIFGNNDQLLYDEFIRVITTDETLNLECSTVDNMLEIIQNNFRFSEEGLVLIVEQNSKRFVNVTIPWERLAQVPATRSFAGIFID